MSLALRFTLTWASKGCGDALILCQRHALDQSSVPACSSEGEGDATQHVQLR